MRVWETRATFKTGIANMSDEERIKLEQECASQGYFDFKSRTAQVLPSLFISTDSNSLILFSFIQVWEFTPSGQSYVRLLAYFTECTCQQRQDDQFILRRNHTGDLFH